MMIKTASLYSIIVIFCVPVCEILYAGPDKYTTSVLKVLCFFQYW